MWVYALAREFDFGRVEGVVIEFLVGEDGANSE